MRYYIYQSLNGTHSTPIADDDPRRRLFERGGWVVVEVVNENEVAEQGESDEAGTVCGDCGAVGCAGGCSGECGAGVDG